MVVYEVNLSIKPAAFEAYYQWLTPHVKEMLNYPGFRRAYIQRDRESSNKLTVYYQLDSYADLENYLNHHAQAMRDEGMKKFAGQFEAQRRIFDVTDAFSQ